MFEITQPTSTPSNQSSRSLTSVGTNPPKSDGGVIRGRPTILSYTLDLEISNDGNPHFTLDVNVKLSKLTPVNGSPGLNILSPNHMISFLPPNGNQGVPFLLTPADSANPPQEGAQYYATGSIQYYEDGTPHQLTHFFNVLVDVQIVE